MPISSGANSWPNQYIRRPASPPKRNVAIKWWNAARELTAPSPAPSARIYPNPNNNIHVVEKPRPSPPPKYDYQPDPYPTKPPLPRTPPREVYYPQSPPPKPNPPRPPPVYKQPPRNLPKKKGGCCSNYCLNNKYYTNGVYNASTGICAGGLFGKQYNNPENRGNKLLGTGQRRCCVCALVTLLALLLLGLLIGLLAGLYPALVAKQNNANAQAQYPNGFYSNGVYYYPITNPPEMFYFAMGFNIPCNVYNNNSNIGGVTVGWATKPGQTSTVKVTQQGPITNPNCNQLTTAFIQANGMPLITTTTTVPFVGYVASANAYWLDTFHVIAALMIIQFFKL